MKEDFRLSLRSIRTRLVESVLLIVGIALGIGATAAGFAMVIRSVSASNELLSGTRYRELKVSVQEETQDMDLPAMVQESDERIILTSADLAAREVSEDIQHAYIMNRTGFRLGVPHFREFGQSSMSNPLPADETQEGALSGEPDMDASPPPLLTEDAFQRDMKSLVEDLPTVEGPEPVLEEMEGYTVSPEFFDAWGLQASEGSFFTESDMKSGKPLLVLGSNLAEMLFEDGVSLGRQVLIDFQLYEIIGILEPSGTSYDDMAFAPAFMPDLQGLSGQLMGRMRSFSTDLYFTVSDSSRLEEAESQLITYFAQEYGTGLVNITIPREEAEQAQDRTSRLVTIILFLALSGLLIAGANVSNILFSRALRKRRTVGILKALGASVSSVFRMFFTEALFVSIGGAVLGAGLSIALSKLMETTMDFAAISGFMLAVGVFLSWLLTNALTILPSMQASKVPAAEAVRYE